MTPVPKELRKSPEQWLKLFQRVNRDCSKSGDPIQLFNGQMWIEVTAEQIYNLTEELDMKYAQDMAFEISLL